MCRKTSIKSWVLSFKFGQWFLKHSSLVFLTKWESQPNASWWLLINTLWRGIISLCFKLGGPLGVALDVASLRGDDTHWVSWAMLLLGPGWRSGCSRGRRGRSPWDRPLLRGGCTLGNVKRWDVGTCPSSIYRKLSACHMIQEDWLPGWLGRWRGSWVDLYSLLQWPLLQDDECLWHVIVEWSWLEKLPESLSP